MTSLSKSESVQLDVLLSCSVIKSAGNINNVLVRL